MTSCTTVQNLWKPLLYPAFSLVVDCIYNFLIVSYILIINIFFILSVILLFEAMSTVSEIELPKKRYSEMTNGTRGSFQSVVSNGLKTQSTVVSTANPSLNIQTQPQGRFCF